MMELYLWSVVVHLTQQMALDTQHCNRLAKTIIWGSLWCFVWNNPQLSTTSHRGLVEVQKKILRTAEMLCGCLISVRMSILKQKAIFRILYHKAANYSQNVFFVYFSPFGYCLNEVYIRKPP